MGSSVLLSRYLVLPDTAGQTNEEKFRITTLLIRRARGVLRQSITPSPAHVRYVADAEE